MRSTPSFFKHSSKIRAPEYLTTRPSLVSIALQEPGRRQALLDVFDGVRVRRVDRRAARAAVESLQIERGLEPADPVLSTHAAIRQDHARGQRLGLIPPTLSHETVDVH